MTRKFTLALMLALCLIAATDATAQNSRLVAINRSYYFNTWSPYDSAVFVYSNGRGGDASTFDGNKLKSDTSFFVRYINNTWEPWYLKIQSFDGNNNILESVRMNWNNNIYTNDTKTTYTYDGNNNKTQETDANWNNGWNNAGRVNWTYDVNNNQTSYTYQTYTNNVWQNANGSVLAYDNNSNMLYSKTMSWNTGSNQWDSTGYWQYYVTNNHEDSIRIYSWNNGWEISTRFIFGYDNNNNQNYMLYQQWNNTNNVWVNTSQDFRTFTNNLTTGDSSQTWNTTNNVWENSSYYGFTYDGNSNTTTYFLKNWDDQANAWEYDVVDSMAYNTFNQRTLYQRLSWVPTTQTWGDNYDNIVKYYYSPYNTSVKTVNSGYSADLLLYPVPVSNTLNLSLQNGYKGDMRVSIHDMQGRLVKQWTDRSNGLYNKPVSVAEIPAGNYIIRIKGESLDAQEKFSIIK